MIATEGNQYHWICLFIYLSIYIYIYIHTVPPLLSGVLRATWRKIPCTTTVLEVFHHGISIRSTFSAGDPLWLFLVRVQANPRILVFRHGSGGLRVEMSNMVNRKTPDQHEIQWLFFQRSFRKNWGWGLLLGLPRGHKLVHFSTAEMQIIRSRATSGT